MSLEIFLMGLLLVSTLTSLVTEAIKNLLEDQGRTYHANALAGYVSMALSSLVSAGYIILTETAWNGKMAVYLIALIFLSWLSAMVGYDKVVQMISQFTVKSS